MSLERDLQSKIAVTQYETLHVQGKDTPVTSGTIDTMGFRDLTIAIVHQDVLAADDDVHIYFEDSPDEVTWTRVPETHVLPTRNYNADGQLVFTPIAPYAQTIGVFDADRFVRVVGIDYTGAQREHLMYIVAIMQAENQQFDLYDPNGRPTDGMP